MHLKNPSLFRQQCYIDGQWIDAENQKTITVTNPFDNKVLGTVPLCSTTETERAIIAAKNAFPAWSMLPAKQRTTYLLRLARLIDDNLEDLATLMTLEQGKPLQESRGEIRYANSFIEWFAEEGRRVYGDIIPANQPNQHLLVLKQPIGVCAAITPWNFPAAMITRKCAPALAAGCTVIIKPAEKTPFTALAIAALAEQAGLPSGVINIITGDPDSIGKELTTNPLVRKFSFTGSTKIGKLLMQQCASTVKNISLELGGNASFIIFDDADITAAINGTIECKFRNTGQTCVCANRIYVQDKIYDNYVEKLLVAVKQLKFGDGLEPDVRLGPLINEAAVEKVTSLIQDAVAKGAKILTGGKRVSPDNLLFPPTILTNMNADMRIANEEIFGPVAAIFRFSSEEEVIKLANHTEYGLASYFYSRDYYRIWRVAEVLECGMVGINTGLTSSEVAPFGGCKQSGIGREGSKYGIDEYVEMKYLCMN